MISNYYAMLFRMKYINRWSLMHNLRTETLSEHSLETAFIAHCLAVLCNKRFGGSLNVGDITAAALFHDTSEVITGDLPTPVKYYNDDIRSAYKDIEAMAEEKLLDMLPDDLRPEFERLYNLDEKSKKIVKAADKLSALIKCKEELSLGNTEFSVASKSTEKSIREMHLPEADAFIEEFLPAFMKGLDENM